MSSSDLAPRDASKQSSSCTENPFASPSFLAAHTLTSPRPCAQPPYYHHPHPPRAGVANGGVSSRHDSTASHPVHYQYKSGSMSSAGGSSTMTPISSIDLEKASISKDHTSPKRPSRESKSRRGSRDPEKTMHHGSRHGSHHSSRPATTAPATPTLDFDTTADSDDLDAGRLAQDQHAVHILLYLSGPCVAVSAVNALWSLLALLITALSQPIRLCARRPSFGQQLAGLLGPTLNLQLKWIYTPLPPHANEDRCYHNAMLLAVHLLSPFVSFAVMFAAWVLAVYWLASGIVGDPAGQDKRDDGKETVLGLRNFWERWLMRSVKEELSDRVSEV